MVPSDDRSERAQWQRHPRFTNRFGAGAPHRTVRAGPRRAVTYWCRNDHATEIRLALDAEEPAVWDCPRCGLPAGQDAQNPPGRTRPEPYKTHLAYVKERRTPEEGRRCWPRRWPRCAADAAGSDRPGGVS